MSVMSVKANRLFDPQRLKFGMEYHIHSGEANVNVGAGYPY